MPADYEPSFDTADLVVIRIEYSTPVDDEDYVAPDAWAEDLAPHRLPFEAL